MKNLTFCLITFTIILFSSACSKDDGVTEVLGCTDPLSLNFNIEANTDDGTCEYLEDKLIGNWDADVLILYGADFIGFGYLKDIEFQFEEDFDFKWSGEGNNGNFYNGSGSWELDGDEVEIDFNSGSDYFCDENITGHDFEFDFNDSYSEVELEEKSACNDGEESGIKIVLDRQ